jgi:NADH-quinone oxidoreductase subunit G
VGKYADYADLDYRRLAEVVEQWPMIGREDLYYGGTSYNNSQGLGVQLKSAAERGETVSLTFVKPPTLEKENGLLAVPVTRLYDRGNTILLSKALQPRLAQPHVVLHPEDADKLGAVPGAQVAVKLNGVTAMVTAIIDNSLPKGVVLVPRSLGMPINSPTPVMVKAK